MAMRRIREFLDGNDVRYIVISHSRAYTASEVAESIHLSGTLLAKVVVVKIDGQLAMAVVPATMDVDMELLRKAAMAHKVSLAEKWEFADRFEGCKLGTAPPLGNLFGVPTYVDGSMAANESIAFNAGTHTDVIKMRFRDYAGLAHPKFAHIAMAADRHAVIDA